MFLAKNLAYFSAKKLFKKTKFYDNNPALNNPTL